MDVLRILHERAAARPAHVVLSEGCDPRVVAGARAASAAGLARITLLGPRDEVAARLAEAGGSGTQDITIIDPRHSDLIDAFADSYRDLRGRDRISHGVARQQAMDNMIFAALMVRTGHADGTLGGAATETSKTMRAALHMIDRAPGCPLVSSFFVMAMPPDHPSGRDAMIFSDCGLVVEPDAAQLAAIATASAESCRQLLGRTPRVALLSFSTAGSARHRSIRKVTDALHLLRAQQPELTVDGELQFDAALLPEIAAVKMPGSAVAGQANVMIFPNLEAGNIGYKIAERLGGARAIGPILQGQVRPANDLSRGCTVEDVVNMIAVTSLQAGAQTAEAP